jgi:hypothetical protein
MGLNSRASDVDYLGELEPKSRVPGLTHSRAASRPALAQSSSGTGRDRLERLNLVWGRVP